MVYCGRADALAIRMACESLVMLMAQNMILVVDDEPNIVRQLSFVLAREQLRVIVASDGEEALRTVRDQRPRVVLLDVMLPLMNGYEVCAAIKDDPELCDTYVALLSAKGQDSDREKGIEMGADEYIVKPFNPVDIARRVKELIERDGLD
jgi:two-component system alkaline phosphatase synthesis response regulator PhoP